MSLNCLFCLLLLPLYLGCESENIGAQESVSQEVLSQAPSACQAYGKDVDVFGFCLVEQVAAMKTPAEAGDLCVLVESWETRCRHRWVSIQRADPVTQPTQVLLDFCDGDSECAFELLEFRVDPDLETQIGLCVSHTSPHVEDCVGHAIQRWWMGDLSEEELLQGAGLEIPYPEKMAFFLGASVACDGIGSCDGVAEAQRSDCGRHVESMTRLPETCPSKQKEPMHGDNPENFTDGGVPVPQEVGPVDESRAPGASAEFIPPEETRDRDPGPGYSPGPVQEPQPTPSPEVQGSPSPSPPLPQPDPGADSMGGGMPSPDPSTHGHVPDGKPGGGLNPPPPNLGGS